MTEEQFDELRPSVFSIAYRMLGSVSEAEDIVQEGFLRLHRAREGGERIESPRAYLSTVVSRLSLDHLRSARVRRETYVGEWLPEPLVASADDDPARKAEIADSLSLAFLVLLESLSPEQRAAYLLREVFDEPYDQIAGIIGTSEQNARQLARARPPSRGRAASPVRGLAPAAGGACEPLLRGRRGGRSPRAGGAAGPRRRLPRRRRRQGARRRTSGSRSRQGGAPADRGAARPRPIRRRHHPPRGHERAAGCAVPRPGRQADQRGDPRHRGGPDPGRERDRQPGQAAAPGAARRPGRAATRAQLDSSARELELDRDRCDPHAREPVEIG